MKNLSLNIDANLEQYIVSAKTTNALPMIPDSKGIRYRFEFPNKWNASVIKLWSSYGWDSDEWELAVIDKDDRLHYNNPICRGVDVIGWLDDGDVNDILHQIAEWEPDAIWPEYEEEV